MSAQSRGVILLIEDELHLLDELMEELTVMGYEAHGAINGSAALRRLETLRPDLIVCDVMMPERSGFEVLSEIRQRHPHLDAIPFIFLTALSDRDHQLEGRRAGADDYLTKPVDFDILDATITAKLAAVARIRAGKGVPDRLAGQIHLSRRETQVLQALGQGHRISEIATKLELSEHTVGQYVKAIYGKLDISSRAEAAREAIRRNLVDLEPPDRR